MRGRPKGIAAHAFVPGNVPRAADGAGSDGDQAAPDIPGNALRRGDGLLVRARVERLGER